MTSAAPWRWLSAPRACAVFSPSPAAAPWRRFDHRSAGADPACRRSPAGPERLLPVDAQSGYLRTADARSSSSSGRASHRLSGSAARPFGQNAVAIARRLGAEPATQPESGPGPISCAASVRWAAIPRSPRFASDETRVFRRFHRRVRISVLSPLDRGRHDALDGAVGRRGAAAVRTVLPLAAHPALGAVAAELCWLWDGGGFDVSCSVACPACRWPFPASWWRLASTCRSSSTAACAKSLWRSPDRRRRPISPPSSAHHLSLSRPIDRRHLWAGGGVHRLRLSDYQASISWASWPAWASAQRRRHADHLSGAVLLLPLRCGGDRCRRSTTSAGCWRRSVAWAVVARAWCSYRRGLFLLACRSRAGCTFPSGCLRLEPATCPRPGAGELSRRFGEQQRFMVVLLADRDRDAALGARGSLASRGRRSALAKRSLRAATSRCRPGAL